MKSSLNSRVPVQSLPDCPVTGPQTVLPLSTTESLTVIFAMLAVIIGVFLTACLSRNKDGQ